MKRTVPNDFERFDSGYKAAVITYVAERKTTKKEYKLKLIQFFYASNKTVHGLALH